MARSTSMSTASSRPDHLLINARIADGCALSVEMSVIGPPGTAFTFEIIGRGQTCPEWW